ncbi:tRNA lysidine(34) synthetase TilS [soil metagenome]
MELSRPLVMVSGGPDSVALLRVLLDLGAKPIVIHIEHGARGAESLEDAKFVEALCYSLDVPCQVRSIRLEGDRNFQERARIERYSVAEELADELVLESIATGHTAHDVAETVLMNLSRGTGLRGLAGIPPVRGKLIRPLIEVTRNEVLEYLDQLGQTYRIDSSNLSSKYSRNRIRQEVLPVLGDLYPGAGNNIARAASMLREDLEALEHIAALTIVDTDDEMRLDVDELLSLPRAIQRYAVRQAYSRLVSGTTGLENTHVEAVLRLVVSREGTRTMDLPGGVVASCRTTGELALYRVRPSECGSAAIEEGVVAFGGWEIEIQHAVAFDPGEATRPEIAYLDAAKGPYRVRMPREGDSIRPLGLAGSKKVSRAMMDRGVPKDLRWRTPTVVDANGRVAWIVAGELSEDHKVSSETENIIRMEARKRRAND